MIGPPQISCDVCGTVKKESNRWFLVAGNEQNQGLTLWPIEEALEANLPGAAHVCGIQCSLKYIAGQMEKMS